MLIEPRYHQRFRQVFCNCLQAAHSWDWILVVAHGHGGFGFWNRMHCPESGGNVPLYYELPTKNFSSGHVYSDFLKQQEMWSWLSSLQFSHAIVTQTDVMINPSASIMPFLEQYDFLGCQASWSRFEYPPPLRNQKCIAANGGFSLRSVPFSLNCTRMFPAEKTQGWPLRKPKHWVANHEDVYFLWGIWRLGGHVPTGQPLESKWCHQRAESFARSVALHKPKLWKPRNSETTKVYASGPPLEP